MTTQETSFALAGAFAALMKRDLTAAEFAEMRQRNTTERYGDGVCASHDFCDANMVMLEAFQTLFGRDPDMDSDAGAVIRYNVAPVAYRA